MKGLALIALAVAASACASPATVTKTRTTLGEVDLTGLECRRETDAGSIRARTICAAPADWAAFEARSIERTQRQLDEADRYTNVFQFGRGP
ncbi:hypothetical protein GC169_12170 [bacterium]|nr:hypothetical protein [bacterium]